MVGRKKQVEKLVKAHEEALDKSYQRIEWEKEIIKRATRNLNNHMEKVEYHRIKVKEYSKQLEEE